MLMASPRWRSMARICVHSVLLVMLPWAHAQPNFVEPGEAGSRGSLRTVGSYPYDVIPYSISATVDGKLLLYGVSPVELDSKNGIASIRDEAPGDSDGLAA